MLKPLDTTTFYWNIVHNFIIWFTVTSGFLDLSISNIHVASAHSFTHTLAWVAKRRRRTKEFDKEEHFDWHALDNTLSPGGSRLQQHIESEQRTRYIYIYHLVIYLQDKNLSGRAELAYISYQGGRWIISLCHPILSSSTSILTFSSIWPNQT